MRIMRLVPLLMAVPLPLCAGVPFNFIRSVAVVQPIPTAPAPVTVTVEGSGSCSMIEIDWGDEYKDTPQSVQLASHPRFSHPYQAGGGKTVTVTAKGGCEGTARTRFVVEQSWLELAFNQVPKPTARICNEAGSIFYVHPHTLVHVLVLPTARGATINFGCPFDGCIYDANGRPGSVADSRFPFPGFREFSLVFKTDPETFQGGMNTSFVARTGGPLQVCLNYSDLTNAGGGFIIRMRQDQLGP